MNSDITFVQNWLIPNEQVISYVDEVLFDDHHGSEFLTGNDINPTHGGSLILTNLRLIIIFGDKKNSPIWYSATHILGLKERPPRYIADWPYQASLILRSGMMIVFQTPKDRIDERGKELSMFLNTTLMNLGSWN